jgi:hypothetical protein
MLREVARDAMRVVRGTFSPNQQEELWFAEHRPQLRKRSAALRYSRRYASTRVEKLLTSGRGVVKRRKHPRHDSPIQMGVVGLSKPNLGLIEAAKGEATR